MEDMVKYRFRVKAKKKVRFKTNDTVRVRLTFTRS